MKDMLGRQRALTSDEALRVIFENLKPELPPPQTVRIEESYGRVLSADQVSPEDLPAFSRSTMDGYAVRAGDTFGASEGSPAYLDVRYDIPMGTEPGFTLEEGVTARIATGGMLPRGADAVLMLEDAQAVDERTIEALKAVAPGDNVIQRAEDVIKGETVLRRGHRIRPQDAAALAGIGIIEIPVYSRPVVSIISTGDEIVPADAPTPGAGRVRDINSYNLAGLVLSDGAEPVGRGIVKDEYGPIRDMFKAALESSDMVLVSGGSSVGARDMTAKVIDEAGAPGVLFHGVSMRPGKPLISGMVGAKPVFGLPGHPAAVTVCYERFIRPVLRVLCGELGTVSGSAKRTLKARMARSLSSQAGREEYVRVSLQTDGNEEGGEGGKGGKGGKGGLVAVPILGKSGLITTLVRAVGTVLIPFGSQGVQEGEEVEVELFD